jgi:5-formyltetrahydrofolate cyclo-ligase
MSRKWPSTTILDGPGAMAQKPLYVIGVWSGLAEAQVNGLFRPHPEFRRRGCRPKRLSELDEWRRARVVKCNPDAPQIPVRLCALYDGKLLFSPVPY